MIRVNCPYYVEYKQPLGRSLRIIRLYKDHQRILVFCIMPDGTSSPGGFTLGELEALLEREKNESP